MTHYKRISRVTIRNIGGITMLSVFVSFFMKEPISKILLASILLTLWIKHLLKENIEEFLINEQERKMRIVAKNFRKERVIDLEISRLEVKFSDKVGARGTWLTVFCVLYDKKEIFRIDPGISGWNDDVLREIITTIKRLQDV